VANARKRHQRQPKLVAPVKPWSWITTVLRYRAKPAVPPMPRAPAADPGPIQKQPVLATTPPKQPVAKMPVERYSLVGSGAGITATRIANLYRTLQSWRKVAHRFSATLTELRVWVSANQQAFGTQLSTEDLQALFGATKPRQHRQIRLRRTTTSAPGQSLGKPGHDTASAGELAVTADVREAIDGYCAEHSLSERDLFHRVVDAMELSAEADKIGIGPGLYEMLVGKFGGVITTAQVVATIERYCTRVPCTMAELFTVHHDPTCIADTARKIGIQPVLYMRLVEFFRTVSEPAPASA
jgi:hypothetical protein